MSVPLSGGAELGREAHVALDDVVHVGDAVAFLHALLPHKPVSELYSVLGRGKQGKTERFREIQRHLAAHPGEQLVRADGVRGMVMAVFTPRALPVVFKVIRDRFAEPKDSVRADIEGKYRLVARRDRIGRLAQSRVRRTQRCEHAAVSGDDPPLDHHRPPRGTGAGR